MIRHLNMGFGKGISIFIIGWNELEVYYLNVCFDWISLEEVWAAWWRDRGAVGGVLLCCLSAVCPTLCYTGAQLASSTFFVCRFFPWWGKILKVILYWLPHVVIILQSQLALVWNERSSSSAISWPEWPSLLRVLVTVLIVNYPMPI